MHVHVTYFGRPRARTVTISAYPVSLSLTPRRGRIALRYSGLYTLARVDRRLAYWFLAEFRVGEANGIAHACRVNLRDRFRTEVFDLPIPAADWTRLLEFGRVLAVKKFLPPILDWMGEELPDPWGRFPIDPVGLCQALCPYPLSGAAPCPP